MKHEIRVLFALVVFLLVIGAANALAEFSISGKTITVSGGGTAIQNAINYINTQDDKENWTILVNSGTYNRFTVLNDMNGLTVKAEDDAVVTVSVSDHSDAPTQTSGSFPNTAGVSIRQANDVIIEGLTFNVGAQSSPWYAAAISNYSESNVRGNNPTVRNCVFNGKGTGIGVFINTGTTTFAVEGCLFTGLKEAISMYGDGTLMQDATVSGNAMDACSFAIHGYYGGTGNAGTLRFVNNVLKGTEQLCCKIVIQDQNNTGAIRTNVSGNSLENAIIGLVNLRESGESNDVLSQNTFVSNSFFVEAVEPGTIQFYTTYHAPKGTMGRWELTGMDDFDVDWGKNPDGSTAFIQEMVDKANAAGSNELVLTGIDKNNLIKTFTWFKDGIYWRDEVGALRIAKTVVGKENGEKFTFTVTLSDAGINGAYTDMVFRNGVATIELADGQFACARNLPAGISYSITEDADEIYKSTSTGSAGIIKKNETAICEFVNTEVEAELPQTGDESTLAIWMMLVAICGVLMWKIQNARG